MSFISKLFKKNESEMPEEQVKGSVEEFVSLVRVYYQAVMAVNLGITNLNMLADMALFKRMLKIPTQNNKLGVAEKYDIKVNLDGGGNKGQAEALRLAIARALVKINPEDKPALKAEGFMTRDPREVERKKPGRPKARKRFQFSKR